MGITYFKRLRMELDLGRQMFPRPSLPTGYRLVPWRDDLLRAHAEVKFRCFHAELDANLFPCFLDLEGCERLMREIAGRDGFVPSATWLLEGPSAEPTKQSIFCGTVQGVRDTNGFGAIQNLGILAKHRGVGLGSVLLHAALLGFHQAGLNRVFLEVTARNNGAVRLYQRLGFQHTKTVFKAIDVAQA